MSRLYTVFIDGNRYRVQAVSYERARHLAQAMAWEGSDHGNDDISSDEAPEYEGETPPY